jgi:hypothetical protein
MAKYRPAGSKKAVKSASPKGAVPCVIVVIFAIGIMCLLFYFTLQSR